MIGTLYCSNGLRKLSVMISCSHTRVNNTFWTHVLRCSGVYQFAEAQEVISHGLCWTQEDTRSIENHDLKS